MKNFLKVQFDQSNVASEIREIRKGQIKVILVKLHLFEIKQVILKAKRKLKGTNIYIEPSLTKKQQDIQQKIRFIAKGHSDGGKEVKMRYNTIFVDGNWNIWNPAKNALEIRKQRSISAPRMSQLGADTNTKNLRH